MGNIESKHRCQRKRKVSKKFCSSLIFITLKNDDEDDDDDEEVEKYLFLLFTHSMVKLKAIKMAILSFYGRCIETR